MAWPLPTPKELADIQADALEEALRLDPATGAARRIDARSPRSVLAALARAFALALYSTHLHIRWWGKQYFPDTAEGAYLERHASIWGIARRGAVAAQGSVAFAGVAGTVIPAGTLLTAPESGAVWQTQQTVTISSGGAASVAVTAAVAGETGNMAASVLVDLVSPVLGLTKQEATVATGGIAGGADIESDAGLRARLLEKIREPAHGGAALDYPRWVAEIAAPYDVVVVPAWVGAGSVGVIIALPNIIGEARVPTSAELAAVEDHLAVQAPVTAEVIVLGATLQPVDIAVQISPFNASSKAAVEAAIAAFFTERDADGVLINARIGQRVRLSRLSEAISGAAGETWHRITAPAADVVITATQFPVAGTINVTEAA
jgi:uncharacterized phage protein gp47/JayE